MELTLEQALQRGVAAHKEGKLQDAERYYTAILKANSKHPDANHNLGVLAVSVNKSDAALPLFKTALEANPKIEQFWLSYIKVLMRLNLVDDAREEIKKCKEMGHKSEEVYRLGVSARTKQSEKSVVLAVEQFYQNNTKRIVSDAASGWLFSDSFDKHFTSVDYFSEMPKKEEHFLKIKSLYQQINKIYRSLIPHKF